MSEEEKQKKRVGSWGEYAATVSKKGLLGSVGVGALLFGIWGISSVLLLLCSVYRRNDEMMLYVFGFLTIIIVAFFGFSILVGMKVLIGVRSIAYVAPPTRQNTASLPAEDVLVRASAEPTEEAGKTLLRATVKGGETPAEELLRPLL